MTKTLLRTTVAAVALIAAATPALAQDVTMRISSWLSPEHAVNRDIWPAFITRVEEVTDGRVTGVVEYGLARPNEQPDLIEDGSADVAWTFHGYNPGRFVTVRLVELPGLVGSSEAASVAHWRAYEQYLSQAGEHEGVRPIAFMLHGPAQVFSVGEIDSLAALEGMKIRVAGGMSSIVGEALGVVPVTVPAPQVYETVASGVADGVVMPPETLRSLRLAEVSPHLYQMPGGFYRGSFVIMMSEDFLDSLSDEDREAILSITGEELSAIAGRAWDVADQEGIAFTEEVGSVHTFSEEDQAAFAEMVVPIRERTLAEVASVGVDAEAALALIEETMANYVSPLDE